MTAGIFTKDKNEQNGQEKKRTVKPLPDCNPIKPSIIKLKPCSQTTHFRECKGEESIFQIRKTEDPEVSEQFMTSLQTAVPLEVCNSHPSSNVESEESNLRDVSVEFEERYGPASTAAPSDLDNHQKTSAPQSRCFTNQIETVSVQLDRCSDSVSGPHIEKPYRAMQSTRFRVEDPRNSAEISDFLTNNLNCIQTKLLISNNSVRPDIYQSEKMLTVSSAKTDTTQTRPCLSMDLHDSQHPETVQSKENSHIHAPSVGPNGACQTEQAATTQQYQSMLETTVLTAHPHNAEAPKDLVHDTLNSGQGSSLQFSGSACFKQTSVQSEESYSSRTCGTHTNVTANKVAVEGDLSG